MNEAELARQVRLLASLQFSRSGGPGGQNVNKVNTKVTLRIPLHELMFTDEELQRLRDRLANRLNADGELVIHSTETRSQAANREYALERAVSMISRALAPPVRRRETRPSKAAKLRRMEAKRRRALRKRERRPPSRDD